MDKTFRSQTKNISLKSIYQTGLHTGSAVVLSTERTDVTEGARIYLVTPHRTEGTAVVAMASRAMSLSGFARRAVHRACPGLATFARPYAANVATVSEEDSFLKWTTPEPQQFTHQSILAAPVTKVRRDARARRMYRAVYVVRAEAAFSPARTRRADPIDRGDPIVAAIENKPSPRWIVMHKR